MRITRSIVPNLFTLANLFMGFYAIVCISTGDFYKGAIFVLGASLFDMLDGIVARLTNSASEFGVVLDSLCDVVSFGVAPAYMLYKVYFYQLGEIGILFASLPALTGAIRLARFNSQVSGFEDKKFFTGMPIPAGALIIISYIIFYHQTDYIPQEFKAVSIFIVTIITSLAMVSRIKYDNVPRPFPKYIKQKPVIFTIFIIGVILCIFSRGIMIFPLMMLYLIASAIRNSFWWIKVHREAQDEIDESEREEPSPYF